MVLFILTRAGWHDIEGQVQRATALWVNHGALTKRELTSLQEGGLSVTTFSSPVDPSDQQAVSMALRTIAEHHPTETIWLELQSYSLLGRET